jgi:site-specific recombinase XerD
LKLTVKRIAKLMKQPGRYGDGDGLVLQVGTPGRGSWLLRYERNGREHMMGLGPLADFSLAEARLRARAARQLLHDGIDPLDAKRAGRAKRAAEAMKAITFGEAAEAYFHAHAPSWKSVKHTAQWAQAVLGRTLSGKASTHDHCRALRSLAVQDIDTATVIRVLEPLWQAKPETASRLRARIEAVLGWCIVRGHRDGTNPAAWRNHLDKILPARTKIARVEHFAALPYAELPAFLATLRLREGVAARALEFLILTATRTSETLGAQWPEFDLSTKIWTVPGRRMKGGREHRIPLSPRALELLREAYREQDNEHVFIGQPGSGLSDSALVQVLRRMGRSENDAWL